LHDALVQASDRMRVSCTVIPTLIAPTARLEIMWDRLRAIRQAVGLVSTPLKALYDSLSGEQKARLNALADSTSARLHADFPLGCLNTKRHS
jgi:LTXXQ motif family protein